MFLLNIIVSLSLFAEVSSTLMDYAIFRSITQKVEILEQNSEKQALAIQQLQKENTDLRASLNDNQGKLTTLITGLMASKCPPTIAGFNTSANNCMIAFHAILDKSIDNLKPWTTIVFGHVITNHGNAYSTTTGIFTAPRPGVYVFYVHIIGSARPMEILVKKNEQYLLSLYSQGNGSYGSDDNMVVVDLAAGDRVYVVKHGPWGKAPFYVHHWWTNFAGFMLYPL